MKVFALLSLIVCAVRAASFDDLAEQVESINSKWSELNAEKDAKIESLTAQIAALNERLQNQKPNTQQRRKLAVPKGAVGLKVLNDKAYLTMGKKKDVSLYRTASGGLGVDAKAISLNGKTKVNGELNTKAVTFQQGSKKCTLTINNQGQLYTNCDISTKTTRQLQAKLKSMKSCDEDAIAKKLTPKLNEVLKYVKPPPAPKTFKSCAEMKKWKPTAKTGMYDLYPAGPNGGKINLKCEMSKQGGGWTRFLQLNGDNKAGCKNYKDVPLNRETVGSYCKWKEFTFSKKMMLESKHEVLFTDDQGRKMWYRFDGCTPNQCTCDMAGSKKGECFFLAVTADYSGGEPVFNVAKYNFDMWVEAFNWNKNRWENGGDGHCGGTNANAHSQWNCEPANDNGRGQCGQRWHYGSRHDGSKKGGGTCGGGATGCAWAWYTGLATSWRKGCNKDNAAWMMSGPKANGQKRRAEVWFR